MAKWFTTRYVVFIKHLSFRTSVRYQVLVKGRLERVLFLPAVYAVLGKKQREKEMKTAYMLKLCWDCEELGLRVDNLILTSEMEEVDK